MYQVCVKSPGSASCVGCEEVVKDMVNRDVPHVLSEFASLSDLQRAHPKATSFPFVVGIGGYTEWFSTQNEPILRHNPDRFTLFPLTHPEIYLFYKRSLASFWTVDEIDLSKDGEDFRGLTPGERGFILNVLAFFAASDGIVCENLAARFGVEVQIPEARAFYAYQILNEAVHSETYSLLIDTLVTDESEKLALFKASQKIPSIKAKADWAVRWMGESSSFAERIVAFAAVEGIMFSSSFAAIYYFKKRGLMPGMCFSNELIARDEGTHCEFAVLMNDTLVDKADKRRVSEIICEAVDCEEAFVRDSLPVAIIGMSSSEMIKYVRFVADRLLQRLGCPKRYNATNPFDWMTMISLDGKANFFEKRVGDYARANVGGGGSKAFSLDAEF